MAFDQKTRNLLQRTVTVCRRVFDREFTAQLQELYGIQPDGTLTPCEALDHLGDEELEVARLLRSRINHLEGGEPPEALTRTQAKPENVARVIREQAFTVLNRLAALRLCEERGLVLECVRQGVNSEGFQLFLTTAGNALGETHEAYRVYLQCLFDELAIDLGVLFDRFSSLALLFPRKDALEEVLRELNGSGKATENEAIPPEHFAEIWRADEAIGWIYQYYNDEAERRQMRELSSAPRDSRELAVRNQFFTPRYVVEFLTDNTLGRVWFEMTRGASSLRERCHYLVRRPAEIFLKAGETAPEITSSEKERNGRQLSQEEFLRQPVYIPHRALKDPREIRLLDPACGSMHFGLYAFDLLTIIYEEAWDIAQGTDEAAKAVETFAPFTRFATTFCDKSAFLLEVPRLIIEHNIHGIDIDPRAAQIAGLSLWLRAQRAWHDAGIRPADRPRITRSNLVCAEPMPGEKKLLREFVDQQFDIAERPAFEFLLEKIFDRMALAGEAGSLLRIEEEIRSAISEARNLAASQPAPRQAGLFPEDERPEPKQLDLQGILDEHFWRRAEQRIYDALETYAEQAENGGGFQRRLFANDAAKGFAFIDLCRKHYDVAVMNPPFGKYSEGCAGYYESAYRDFKSDIGIAFVDRFTRLVLPTGCVGAITSRSFLASDSLDDWRRERLLDATPLHSLLDLGYGVLDGAMVEAAAYVVDACSSLKAPRGFIRALECREKEQAVREFFMGPTAPSDLLFFLHDLADFRAVPLAVICYWLPASLLHKLQRLPALPESGGAARHGLVTTDDWRFLRLAWEVAPNEMRDGGVRRWKLLAKGGEYQPFWDDIHICVDWSGDGDVLKRFLADKRLKTQGSADWSPWLNHSEYYGLEGLTYPERTTSDFCPRVLPKDVIFSSTGQAIQFDRSRERALAYLCGSFTRFFKLVVESFVGSGDNAFPGSAAKHYRSGLLNQLPAPLVHCSTELERIAQCGIAFARSLFVEDETARNFCPAKRTDSLRQMRLRKQAILLDSAVQLIDLNCEIEDLVSRRFDLGQAEAAVLNEIIGPHPNTYSDENPDEIELILQLWKKPVRDVVEFCIRRDGPRRQLTKKTFIADRKLELICHGLKLSPRVVAEAIKSATCLDEDAEHAAASDELSFALGSVFGRWDIRYATGERTAPEIADPFQSLPVCPVGMLRDEDGLPLSPDAGSQLQPEGTYPIEVAWDGILVDDPEHALDVGRCVHAALSVVWNSQTDAVEREACELLGISTLRDWFRRPAGFFLDHLTRYSKSRRQAPIYWPLSTASGRYTLWLYYHRLTPDTLYKCLQQFVVPKLGDVEKEISRLRTVLIANEGGSKERKSLEDLEELRRELIGLRAELEFWAPKWKPNLNDGALLTAAPLWKLFRLPKWQKDLKACWKEMERGDYDWAHLAFSLWPERVREKCKSERSIAIAHGLEDLCEVEVSAKKPKKGKKMKTQESLQEYFEG